MIAGMWSGIVMVILPRCAIPRPQAEASHCGETTQYSADDKQLNV